MEPLVFVPIFILGTIFGSFLNVVIYRLPRGESLVKPRSHCPECKKQIPFYRNIPLISFVLQRGRCNQCGQKIAWRYPLVEIISGLIWGFCFTELALPEALIAVSMWGLLLVVACLDQSHQKIPVILLLLTMFTALTSVILGASYWRLAVMGAIIGGVIPGLAAGIMFLISKTAGLGAGDLLLGLSLGIWLGPYNILLALILACGLTLVIWGVNFLRRKSTGDQAIAFAPYLIIATAIVYITSYYHNDLIEGLFFN